MNLEGTQFGSTFSSVTWMKVQKAYSTNLWMTQWLTYLMTASESKKISTDYSHGLKSSKVKFNGNECKIPH